MLITFALIFAFFGNVILRSVSKERYTSLLYHYFFVPVVNFIVLLALWVWLMKDTFRYDAASLLFEKVDNERIKEHGSAIWMTSFVAAFFNFVPVLNLFGPFFGEIAMFHFLLENHTRKKGV